jgi:shikimate kinase
MSVQPSLVVIGRRGSGLSSFALIAARLTGFTIIDVDAHFVSEHGMPRTACLRDWGEQQYRETAAAFLRGLLSRHQHSRILVCASEAADSNSQALVRACASGAHVIMISRDDGATRRHLSLADSPEVQHILTSSTTIYQKSKVPKRYLRSSTVTFDLTCRAGAASDAYAMSLVMSTTF